MIVLFVIIRLSISGRGNLLFDGLLTSAGKKLDIYPFYKIVINNAFLLKPHNKKQYDFLAGHKILALQDSHFCFLEH